MNNKAKVIKLLLILVPTIISIIVITFAWFMVITKTDPIIIRSGTLRVEANLYYEDDDGEYVEITESITFSNIIPGAVFKFKLTMKNAGSIDGHLMVDILSIVFSDEIIEEAFELCYIDPSDKTVPPEEKLIPIDQSSLKLFKEYKLDSQEEFDFYFCVRGTEIITQEMQGMYLKLTSFLITLDQIQPNP